MTVLMQCLGCGTIVTNPHIMNYIYEKCDFCYPKQVEAEKKALKIFTQEQSEREQSV